MCRKLIVVNELYLGARQLGWEAYSLPKGEIVEFTDKQLRNLILTGKEDLMANYINIQVNKTMWQEDIVTQERKREQNCIDDSLNK